MRFLTIKKWGLYVPKKQINVRGKRDYLWSVGCWFNYLRASGGHGYNVTELLVIRNTTNTCSKLRSLQTVKGK